MMKNMMMNVLMIVGMTWALSDPKWVVVGSVDSNITYLDAAHVSVNERSATVWTRQVYGSVKYVNYRVKSKASIGTSAIDGEVSSNMHTVSQLEGDDQSYSFNNERILQEIDCQHRQVANIMVVRYFNNEVVFSQDNSRYDRQWSMVIPGTIGASTYNMACPDDVNSYVHKNVVKPINNREDGNTTSTFIFITFVLFSSIVAYVGLSS